MRERRVAFVTGGAKGIGRAIVEKLASEGFSVAVNYNKSEKKALELVSKLQNSGVNAIAVQADMSNFAEAERAFTEAKRYFGFIDTLVNNAGVSLIKPLYDCDEADYAEVMDNNFRSAYNASKLFSADMVN